MLKRIITALMAVVMVASMSVVAFAEHRTPSGGLCNNTYTQSVHTGTWVRSVNGQHTLSDGSVCHTVGVYYMHQTICSSCKAPLGGQYASCCYATHSSPLCPSRVPYCYAFSAN